MHYVPKRDKRDLVAWAPEGSSLNQSIKKSFQEDDPNFKIQKSAIKRPASASASPNNAANKPLTTSKPQTQEEIDYERLKNKDMH